MSSDEDKMATSHGDDGGVAGPGWDASPSGAYIFTSGKSVVIIPASQDKQQLALHWNTGTASIFWWSILDKGVL